jgi:ATP-binding cassette, subfamily A (ABC1), member 3
MGEFTALLNKNFIIWKRNKASLIAEIIIVTAFAFVIGIFKHYSPMSSTEAKSYISSPFPLTPSNTTQPFPANYQSLMLGYKINSSRPFNPVYFKNPLFKNCTYDPSNTNTKPGGVIGISPNDGSAIIQNLTTFFQNVMNYTVKGFNSKQEIDNYVIDDNYGGIVDGNQVPALCLAINFDSKMAGAWNYSLMYNLSGNPSWYDLVPIEQPQVIKFQKDALSNSKWQNQFNSGFQILQEFIMNFIVQSESLGTLSSSVYFVPSPSVQTSSLLANTNNGDLSFFIMFPLTINFLKFVYNMLNEKEKRITENMRNMGMSLYKHYFSWLLFNTILLFVISLVWSVIAKIVFFKYSSYPYVFGLMFLPGLTMQSVSFFIAAFFTKAKMGIVMGLVASFVFDLFRVAKQSITNPSEGLLMWMSLSPSEAVSSASSGIVTLESTGIGMHGVNFNELVNQYKYSWFIAMQLLSATVFLLLGIYLDQVWPTEIGMKRHPLFFILDFCPKKKQVETNPLATSLLEGEQAEEENFEQVEDQLMRQSSENKTLKIQNLRKVYPNGKVAVHRLNLEMYTDQIFALLGHNGAGKTTTISMISGLLTQTEGNITLLGRDTKEDAKHNRKILGVCPQTNPIYENLTCKEHLVLYATIKKGDSVPEGQPVVTETEIDNILKDLDLFDKKDYPASKLSGGQKRKLCVACAFIGGSKVILLDEPTSGMDTYARRFLWEMLKNYKKDRIIILSTHYMDEADYLGDRIAIMGKGKLITCGSSLFLKKRFGAGYDLTVVKKDTSITSESIEAIVTKFVPTAKKCGDISMEIKFQLPATESAKFEALFADFEKNKEMYGIQTFGISLTTLEEVFLKVAGIVEDGEENKSTEETPGVGGTIAKHPPKITKDSENFELNDIRIKDPTKLFWTHFWALVKKRFIYFKRDKRGLICELYLPALIVLMGMFMTTIKFIKECNSGIVNPQILGKTNFVMASPNSLDITALKTTANAMASPFAPNLTLSYRNADTLADYNSYLVNVADPTAYYSVFVDKFDTVNKIYSYNCFVNTTAPWSVQICVNFMERAIYKVMRNDPKAELTTWMTPMKLTKQVASFQNTAVGFVAAFIISISYAFIPASLIVIIVKERENNVKHQQIVSGVSILAYWLSNLFIDFIKYLVPASLTVGILFLYNASVYTTGTALSATISLFVLFGPSMIIFTYLFSFLFTSPSKAQFIIFLLSYLGGSILMILSFILRLIQSTRSVQLNFLEYIFRFLPIYDISFGMFSMANGQIWQYINNNKMPGPWDRLTALPSVIYLAVLPIFYFLLILFIEAKGNRLAKSMNSNPQDQLNFTDEDPDVAQERLEVEKGDNFAVKVHNLMIEYVLYRNGFCKRKQTDTKLAVKGVSFGVKKGECFGLLGTNGAGKTSTFKVLSGEILPNYGKALIANMNTETDMKHIGSLIGYCPQFDALLENLTAREHLELYAAIKGIPENMRESLIQNKLRQLNLKQYENVLAGTYSGGNKRKLSVAIALLGNPPIILLDEPSSGMDPEARRFMWSVVSEISVQNKTSSVILTTHSMEEAEALSTKLAIMVEGRIKCIGPVQALKSKFGKGFEIEVKIRLPTNKEIAELQSKAGTEEERISTTDKAIKILLSLGVKNAEYEFCPNGKCSNFQIQVVSELHRSKEASM